MVCQLTPAQEARMYEILRGIADDPHALEMQQFIQHGTVTTYEHCLRVTRIAYWLNLHWHCHAEEVSLVQRRVFARFLSVRLAQLFQHHPLARL